MSRPYPPLELVLKFHDPPVDKLLVQILYTLICTVVKGKIFSTFNNASKLELKPVTEHTSGFRVKETSEKKAFG